jgi:lipopolysaccharide assembly outer membrane protein LptD (OstA)/DNA-binding beta-propeller fold protein YncE
MTHGLRIGFVALATAAFMASVGVRAQSAFEKHDTDAVLRDAVIDNSGGMLYATAYDRDEVWKIDLATGTRVASVAVEEGPTALALSRDGAVLACVNRIAGSVTLIRTDDLQVAATVPCPGSADAVSALPGGGFAVANSFNDSITLIDANEPQSPAIIEGVTSVPSSVAASESFLAVTTRTPAQLLVYAGGSRTPAATVPVPESPFKVIALPNDQFLVAARTGVAIVDAASSREIARRELAVYDAAVNGTEIFLLTEGSIETCDASLNATASQPVSETVRAIAAAGGAVIALSPKDHAWYSAGAVSAPALTVAAAEPPSQTPAALVPAEPPAPVVEEPAPEPIPVEATPAPAEPPAAMVVEPELTPAPAEPVVQETPEVIEAAPVAPMPLPAAEPKTFADPKPVESEPTPEPSSTIEVAGATDEPAPMRKSDQPRTSRIRRNEPAVATETESAGPEAPRRPAASPLEGGLREPSVGDALTEGLDLGTSEGGFQPPDWTQPFRDIQGENVEVLDNGNILIATGDARLSLDTIQFAADRVFYDKRTGQVEATGNVEVVQGESTAWADRVQYTVPLDAELQNPPPLLPSGEGEQDYARRVLSLGKMDATNIEIYEPTREFKADHIIYDFATKTGEAWGVEGQTGQVRFGGERLTMLGEGDVSGENLWLTTCDCDHEYYRIRMKEATIKNGQAVTGKSARLELGGTGTPLWWPRWGYRGGADTPTVGFDFDSGKKAELGYYINVGQQFAVTPNLELGIRFFPTSKEGVGFGLEGQYDFMETPAEPLFRSKGEFRSLITTDSRGYYEWFHRHELDPDTVMLVQMEQWSDREFYKDFFYEAYKDRTQPRNFVNVTHTQPTYIATATARKTTNEFVSETERMPEVTFHLLERQLVDRLYFTFDTVAGYNEREPEGENALRNVNVARLSYDVELGEALNLTPYLEADTAWYGKTRDDGDSDGRLSAELGATLQTRFQRTYDGRWGFSGFKHIVLPSLTYSYRPDATLDVEDTPRFDAYDNVYGRSRLESKIDNIVMGRDAETGEAWQVARLSLYYGDDFSNEIRDSRDYELELDLRPRPLWGVQTIAEHHSISDETDIDLDRPFIVQRGLIELYERVTDEPFDPETADKYNTAYGDYDRLLAFFYYDDRNYGGNWNGRIGFAYTKTQDEVFNREILYGVGYKLGPKWSVAFEHRYDFERGELYRQRYEVRRVLQCLEGAIQVTERGSGWDLGVEFSLTGIPGTRLKF